LVVAVVLFLVVRRLDFKALAAALRQAALLPLLVAAVFGLGNLWFKAVMWRTMLRGGPARVPVWRLFRYTVAAFAASALTPARAGEVLRMWLLRRHHQVPYARSAGAALAEKVLDAFGISLFVMPLLWLPSPLQTWTRIATVTLATVAVGLIALAALATQRVRSTGRLGSFLLNIRILHDPAVLVRALGSAIAASALDFGMLWLSLRACGIGQDFAGTAFVLLVTNAVLVVPTTPGNLGSLEAGGILAVGLLGVARPQAVAFVLLYHAVQLGPLFLFTLFNLNLVFGAARPTEREEPPPVSPVRTERLGAAGKTNDAATGQMV